MHEATQCVICGSKVFYDVKEKIVCTPYCNHTEEMKHVLFRHNPWRKQAKSLDQMYTDLIANISHTSSPTVIWNTTEEAIASTTPVWED